MSIDYGIRYHNLPPDMRGSAQTLQAGTWKIKNQDSADSVADVESEEVHQSSPSRLLPQEWKH